MGMSLSFLSFAPLAPVTRQSRAVAPLAETEPVGGAILAPVGRQVGWLAFEAPFEAPNRRRGRRPARAVWTTLWRILQHHDRTCSRHALGRVDRRRGRQRSTAAGGARRGRPLAELVSGRQPDLRLRW